MRTWVSSPWPLPRCWSRWRCFLDWALRVLAETKNGISPYITWLLQINWKLMGLWPRFHHISPVLNLAPSTSDYLNFPWLPIRVVKINLMKSINPKSIRNPAVQLSKWWKRSMFVGHQISPHDQCEGDQFPDLLGGSIAGRAKMGGNIRLNVMMQYND